MKYITLILNSAFMGLCGLGSCIAHLKVTDITKRPEAYHDYAGIFPPLTAYAVTLRWMWWAVPATWVVLSLVLLLAFRKKDASSMQNVVSLHTSATLVAGLAMLVFFLTSGIVPFVDWPPSTCASCK
jgi:hypothetical protein